MLSSDPDTYFQTFIFNVILLMVTLSSIFLLHPYREEYFIRKNVMLKLD